MKIKKHKTRSLANRIDTRFSLIFKIWHSASQRKHGGAGGTSDLRDMYLYYLKAQNHKTPKKRHKNKTSFRRLTGVLLLSLSKNPDEWAKISVRKNLDIVAANRCHVMCPM